ncbi:MAG: hypothetical protein ACR2KZ_08490 [Segetibacter sp.]
MVNLHYNISWPTINGMTEREMLLADSKAEMQYADTRLRLYKQKEYSGRAVSNVRMRELQQKAQASKERYHALRDAEKPVLPPT